MASPLSTTTFLIFLLFIILVILSPVTAQKLSGSGNADMDELSKTLQEAMKHTTTGN